MVFVKKFCCCDLQTGTLVYAILSIIISGGSFLGYLVDLCSSSNEKPIGVISVENRNETHEFTAEIAVYRSSHYGIVGATINLIISGCLLYGTLKEKRFFLLPWLIMSATGTAIIALLLIIGMFIYPIVILFWLIIAPFVYIWVCVLSYYQTLDPRNPNHPTQIPTYTTGQQMPTYNQQPPNYNQVCVPEVV